MTYQLVCEGVCNPDRPSCDAAVREERRRFNSDRNPIQPITDLLAFRLRRLRHTAHEMLSTGRAACLVCTVERRYGKEE